MSSFGTGLKRTELSQTDLSPKVTNGTFVTGTKVPKEDFYGKEKNFNRR